jgi:hypothetical protein
MKIEIFDKVAFWEELRWVKDEYDIRVSGKVSNRSAKRITVLVSNAYLESNGDIHWIQCLEAELYKACKERNLECDPLELEAMERNYFCRKTRKKVFATAFDNHRINTTIIGETPKAKLFADIITDYLALEEEVQDDTQLSRSDSRERPGSTFEYQKADALSTEEARIPLRGTFKDPSSLLG